MGVLPLQFLDGESAETHGIEGDETFAITGIEDALDPGGDQKVTMTAEKDGETKEFEVAVRLDTPQEVNYYRHGGILQYVLDRLQGVALNDTVQYGESNVAQLGDDDLDLQLQTGGSQVDFTQEQEAQRREFSSGTASGGVDVQAADYDSGGREYDESEIALINEYSCQQRGDC